MLDTRTCHTNAQEAGPDLIGLLVGNGGFATAVHARQLHTAAAIAVHLLKVQPFLSRISRQAQRFASREGTVEMLQRSVAHSGSAKLRLFRC